MTRTISQNELRGQNGDSGSRVWVARAGIVYDVTDCPKWRTGLHENMHFAGLDLSEALPGAPHAPDVLDRPCVKVVGRLAPPEQEHFGEGPI
jgi:predicted heme/steroid binding protein